MKISLLNITTNVSQIYLGFLFNYKLKQHLKMKDKKHIQSFNEHQENLNISDVIDSKYLEKLTDSELKSLFTTENTKDLSDDGIVAEIKRYILSGKRDFTMNEKINEIEKMTMLIVVDRWLKSV